MMRRLTMLTVGVIGGALIWAGAACLEDGVSALRPAHTLCRTDGIYHECNPPTTVAPFISPTTAAPITTTTTPAVIASLDPAGCYEEPSLTPTGREVIEYDAEHVRTVEGIWVPCPSEPTDLDRCIVIVPPIDEPDGLAFEAFSAAYGGQLDYNGGGTWTDRYGRTVGYADAEDSPIWDTATCADTEGAHR